MLKPLPITYAEIPQVNPLRWTILLRNEDGSFSPQSGLIKCKDFFNDLVGKYYGTSGAIYGFDTKSIKVNDDGVWFLLTHVHKNFQQNLHDFLNPLLNDVFGEGLHPEYVENGGIVLKIPKTIFSNTYYVSLVTFLIRVCSMNYLHKDLEDVFHNPNNPCRKDESQITDVYKRISKWGFNLPEDLKKYWFYCGPDLNSETHPDIARTQISVLHNNGIMSWSYASQMKIVEL